MRATWAGLVLAGLLTLGCGGDDGAVDGGGESPVDRGRYLVNNVGLCTFCHTPLFPDGTRDTTRFLAGDDCLVDILPDDPEKGCLPSRNLTPDVTGLKNRSDELIKRAIRNGIRTDDKNLSIGMPAWLFHNLTDDDVSAIVAYLRTIPAVDHQVKPRQPPWDDVPSPIPFIDPSTIPQPRADYPNQAAAKRGRYLAGMAGLCIDCHTPDDTMMTGLLIDRSKFFQGNRAFPAFGLGLQSPPYPAVIYTANLTSDAETGVGSYTLEQFKTVFKVGKDRKGDVLCAPTHGGPSTAYAGLHDSDIEDIGHYLLSLPAVKSARTADCKGLL